MSRSERASVVRVVHEVLGIAGAADERAALLRVVLLNDDALLEQLREVLQQGGLQRRLSPGTSQ